MRKGYWTFSIFAGLLSATGFGLATSAKPGVLNPTALDQWYLWQLPIALIIGGVLGLAAGHTAPAAIRFRPHESAADFASRVVKFGRPAIGMASLLTWTYGMIAAISTQMVVDSPAAKLRMLALEDFRFWALGVFAAGCCGVAYGFGVFNRDWGGRYALWSGKED
jgi:hypothetical protein